ncbi:hypothetical protein D0962_22170 [Leptolyngbyaceae cyanobacterium CCMR0082]|uniref:Putative restriction endonuclease domain-containing protein n=1 Tax=Adonisia turfae CCMR0082 TaxID=2304604 RepID=A0A6M0SAF0_9CYAN|nr:Uma2 family endonuclease [Adonisia turfae]NEZ65444.1 hypothetical protein [Adonisia turfae CCMR0082]
MVQRRVASPMNFEAFLDWYPDDGYRYELIEGVVVEMLPTGPHEDIGGFLSAEFNFEIRRNKLPYSIPRTCLVKPHAEKYQIRRFVAGEKLVSRVFPELDLTTDAVFASGT